MSDGIRLAKDGRFNLLRAAWAAAASACTTLMRRLIREGWLRDADPTCSGMAFVSPLMLWRQMHAIDADLPMIRNPRAFARQHVEQFLLGAGAPPSSRAAAARAARTRIAQPSRRRVAARRQSS